MSGDTAATYAALRYGGETPARVRAFLKLELPVALRLEAAFRGAPAGNVRNAMRPRFARDEGHLQAVKQERGVFPIMPGAHR